MKRVLAAIGLVVSCVVAAQASESQSKPVAILGLSQLAPRGSSLEVTQSVAFISDTSIAVGLCQRGPGMNCSLFLIRCDGDILKPYATTSHYRAGMSIHAFSTGQILAKPMGTYPVVLFSADLSEEQYLPSLYLASRSGNTVAEQKGTAWKIYRLLPRLAFVREGRGELQAISDTLVAFRVGDVMNTETAEGTLLGSFSVRPKNKCYSTVQLASNDRLYWEDCKGSRMVDFTGKKKVQLHPPKGWGSHWDTQQFWSADGKRVLFDHFDRKISVARNTGEILGAVMTLGMGVGDEQDNREEVQVLDTITGASCFDWKRQFPEGSEAFPTNAAISPSGELVAIVAGGAVSIYRLPTVCGPNK